MGAGPSDNGQQNDQAAAIRGAADKAAADDVTNVRPWPGGRVPGIGYVPPLGGPVVPSTLSLHGVRRQFGDPLKGFAEQADPLVRVLLAMLRHGAHSLHFGPKQDRFAPHHPSLVPEAMRTYIRDSLKYGAVLGPWDDVEEVREFLRSVAGPGAKPGNSGAVPLHHVPCGTVDKPGTAGRVIKDMSFGNVESINFWITMAEQDTVVFDRLPVVTRIIREARRRHGPDAPLRAYKLDIEAAFRRVVLRVADWWMGLTGVPDDDGAIKYWLDIACTFGMRSSVFIYCLFSAAMRRWGHDLDQLLAIYMDDIFGIAQEDDADAALQRIIDMVLDCGFTVQPKKIVPPASVVEYIGVIVDLERLEYRISPERLAATMALLRDWRQRRRASRRELESIVGKLAWIAQLVPFARLFIHRLLGAMRGLHRAHHRVRITREMRLDLAWWEEYLPEFNGVPILPETLEAFDLDFATDASGWGYGAHLQELYFCGQWSAAEADRYDINVRELWTVFMAVDAFRERLRGRRVRVLIDNQAAVAWLTGWRTASDDAARLLRRFFVVLAQEGITLLPEYIATDDNVRADALSRDALSLFLAVSHGLGVSPVLQVPSAEARGAL